MSRLMSKPSLAFLFVTIFLAMNLGTALAQGQSGDAPGKSKKQEKQKNKTDKAADKLAKTAKATEDQLGRDVVFCILAAHTTDVGTAQQLKDKFAALKDVPFGQFVAAVIMADRIDKPLDEILLKLQAGKSLGQIAQEFDVDMAELRGHFGEFRSELARSQTTPPTRDCFKANG